jgi:precorrin-2 dehydrogenase/sirohydrochlorin ferrochelatase
MRTFPIQIALRDTVCAVVGAGLVAERKVLSLYRCGAKIRLVSPEATDRLQQMAKQGQIDWRQRVYRSSDLEGAFLVFTATNSIQVNQTVTEDAKKRALLVCRTDLPTEGNFSSPSTVIRGDLTLTVSTSGVSPTLAAVLREQLAIQFGPSWEPLTALIGKLRPLIQQIPHEAARKSAVRKLIDDPDLLSCLNQGQIAEAEVRAQQCLSSCLE